MLRTSHVRYVSGRLSTATSSGSAGVRNVSVTWTLCPSNWYTVRVGSTVAYPTWGIASTPLGSSPISRSGVPSTRIMPVSRFARLVQWRVTSSVSLSALDQMLNSGLHATSGTDGGRCCDGSGLGWP